MALPEQERLAFHEAGHAVVQHWVARGRYRVTLVSLAGRGSHTAGCSLIDREINLSLYEYGLVTLAGIAAEERYFEEHPLPDDFWGAVGDMRDWQGMAEEVLGSNARIELVTRRLQKKLREFFSAASNWGTVCRLATELLHSGSVEGQHVQELLQENGQNLAGV